MVPPLPPDWVGSHSFTRGDANAPLYLDKTLADSTDESAEGSEQPRKLRAAHERLRRAQTGIGIINDWGKPAEFTSYVGVHPDHEESDPDGLDHHARMALEAKAIEFIQSREQAWRRTPTHNPGYDLYMADEGDNVAQWCEVKAMTGSLDDHPVGLSRTQFDCAKERGETYWLYIVEHVDTDAARIIRIQDPAGKARTFTFDRGWVGVAEPDDPTG